MQPNFFIEDNGNVYIVFNFNFSGKKGLLCWCISGFNLIIKQCKELINCC